MEFFYTNQSLNYSFPFQDGNKVSINVKSVNGNPDLTTIHVATGACVETLNLHIRQGNIKPTDPQNFKVKVLDQANKQQIYGLKDFPIVLSNFDGTLEERKFEYTDPTKPKLLPSTPFIPLEDKIEKLKQEKKDISVFVLNGMGTGLGDGLIGLRALNIFYTRLKKYFNNVEIVLGHTAVIGTKAHRCLYDQEKIVKEIVYLPVTVDYLLKFDIVVDFTAMIIRESFTRQHMIDFYLENFAIDPKSIPDQEKRPFVKLSDKAKTHFSLPLQIIRNENPKSKLILLHPSASAPIRSMPRNLLKNIIKHLMDTDPNWVIITWEKMDDIKKEIETYLGRKKSRYIDMSFKNVSFDMFAYMISQVDGIVTTDTSTYHIADSFDIPCVVLFHTIKSDYRIKYYPLCSGIQLVKGVNELDNVHLTFDQNHMKYINEHWNKFNYKVFGPELKKMMAKKNMLTQNDKNYISCPICEAKNYQKAIDRYLDFQLIECKTCLTDYSVTREEKPIASVSVEFNTEQTPEQLAVNYLNSSKFEPFINLMQSVSEKGDYLDLGCSVGYMVYYAKNIGFNSFGIDTNKDLIDKGIAKFGLQNQLFTDFSDAMPKQFNVISSFDVLEHLADPIAYGKKIYDLLKPGGWWYFSVPNRNRIQYKAGIKNSKHKDFPQGEYPQEYLQRFRPEALKILVEKCGFTPVIQQSNRLVATTVKDISGEIPDFDMVDPHDNQKKIMIPKVGLESFFDSYYQNALDAIQGYGNYLISISRKPL